MRVRKILSILLPVCCLVTISQAQQRKMPGWGTSPIKVGTQLADATAYLANGQAYPLRENLKGKHAVLVFGCLT